MRMYLLLVVLGYVSIIHSKFTTVGIYSKQASVNVTVWVHGTHPVRRLTTCKISPLRKQMYAPMGLSLARELPEKYYFRSIACGCDKLDPEQYPLEHFYLFGWNSAKVTPKQRKKAGEQLCRELNHLLADYHKKYRKVNLRIIGFSHGGNVILNCMNCLPFRVADVETEAILLATPIQESTRLYANSPHVKKVYSFYSDGDWIQRIDMQKLHSDAPRHCPFWSKRTFADTDRVVQVQLQVNGKNIGHLKYRDILPCIPDLMQQVNMQVGKKCKDHMFLDFKTTGKL